MTGKTVYQGITLSVALTVKTSVAADVQKALLPFIKELEASNDASKLAKAIAIKNSMNGMEDMLKQIAVSTEDADGNSTGTLNLGVELRIPSTELLAVMNQLSMLETQINPDDPNAAEAVLAVLLNAGTELMDKVEVCLTSTNRRKGAKEVLAVLNMQLSMFKSMLPMLLLEAAQSGQLKL